MNKTNNQTMKTSIMRPPQNRRGGFRQRAAFPNEIMFAALCRDAATKPISHSMFSVQCLLLNVAVFATAASALADVHYVDVNSTNATPPYTNWSTAATNIQDAVDAAVAGDEIVVTNGIYATGGRNFNRVDVGKPLNLRSVNGPQFTTIAGANGFFRCVYLTNNATLSGFTLTNGVSLDAIGGGVWCAASNAVVSDCVISGNQALAYYYWEAYGGGAYGGTLNNCTLVGNSSRYVPGDGDYGTGLLLVCGGGAAYCTLNHCTVSQNSAAAADFWSNADDAQAYGGGAYQCTLNNCTLTGNLASVTSGDMGVFAFGGGASFCTLNNCIVTGNSAAGNYGRVSNGENDGGSIGGGVFRGQLSNCILYYNSPDNYTPYGFGEDFFLSLNYCCTTPLPTRSTHNVTNAPPVRGLRLRESARATQLTLHQCRGQFLRHGRNRSGRQPAHLWRHGGHRRV